jgi:hypothetical protein
MSSRSAFFALSLCAGLIPGVALAGPNEETGPAPKNATAGSLAPNHGHVLCSAAINSDGSIATALAGSYIDHTKTFRLTTGQYQVGFNGPCGNVQAVNGWFHIVQVDRLTAGFPAPAVCTTADRAGVPSAVFVRCFCASPSPPFVGACDTSFELSVSR